MSDARGLERPADRAPEAGGSGHGDAAGRRHASLSPEASAAAHRGIMWLHIGAIAIWLFVAALFGGLMAAGKNVPAVLVAAVVAAAAGHGLFLVVHLVLGSRARRRAATGSGSTAG